MRGFLAASDFDERAGIRFNGFRNSLAVNKLSFAVAGDQPGFAENLQVMRNGRGGHAAHRDDLATVHMFACRNGLENSEACLVGKGSRYLFNVRAIHWSARSVAGFPSPHHLDSPFRTYHQERCNRVFRYSSKHRNVESAGSGGAGSPPRAAFGHIQIEDGDQHEET